jgi:flagellin
MRINHNISSLNAQGALFRVHRESSKSLEKLSTGLRINRASDDAAGLGVSENLRTQVRGIGQAMNNTQDFIALLNIAEGALNEMSSIMQRMRELVIQAKNDTYTQTERNYMGDEFLALVNELDRIAQVTNYNGMTLFADRNTLNWTTTGNQDPKTAQNATTIWDDNADAVFGANDNGRATHFNMMVGQNYTAEDAAAFNGGGQLNSYDKTAENLVTIQLGQMDSTGLFFRSAQMAGNMVTYLTGVGGTVNAFDLSGPVMAGRFGDSVQKKLQTLLELIDGKDTTHPTAGALTTAAGTNFTGIERINRMRAYIGATINRLEHTTNNLMSAETNQQAAESVIRDVDFAHETTNFTKTQILTQTAISMLAQANVNPMSIMRLIG